MRGKPYLDLFCQGLAALLQASADCTLVGQAKNGGEAWDLIEKLPPDVAILDINMPTMTGIDVACRLLESGRATRALTLTMHSALAAAQGAQAAGAAGYVLKDNAFEELLTAIRIVSAGGTFVTASIHNKRCFLEQRLSPRRR